MTRSEKVRATRKKNTERWTQWALRKIRKHQPKNLLEVSELGMVCVHVGEGSFRRSYRIANTTLIIKFPIVECPYTYATDDDGKYHTRAEVRKIRALSKFKCLRMYLPPVYYYSSADGVMVTKFYKFATERDWAHNIGPILSGTIKALTGVTLEDLFGDNMRLDKDKNRLIFVDLGY
jgi:hypothetical protein